MEARQAMTVRLPRALAQRARQTTGEGESLNDLMVAAVEREVRRRQALAAHEVIVRTGRRIAERTGTQGSSAALIRRLRAGQLRRG